MLNTLNENFGISDFGDLSRWFFLICHFVRRLSVIFKWHVGIKCSFFKMCDKLSKILFGNIFEEKFWLIGRILTKSCRFYWFWVENYSVFLIFERILIANRLLIGKTARMFQVIGDFFKNEIYSFSEADIFYWWIFIAKNF